MKDAFNQQMALQRRMGANFRPGHADIEEIKNWILAAHTELSEALQTIPWKPWKDYPAAAYMTWDRAHLLEELVDVQHFLFNAVAYAGFTAEQYEEAWHSKNGENHNRLTEGINKVLEQEPR